MTPGFAGAAGLGLVFGWMAGRLSAHRTARAAVASVVTLLAGIVLSGAFLGPAYAVTAGVAAVFNYLAHVAWRYTMLKTKGETHDRHSDAA